MSVLFVWHLPQISGVLSSHAVDRGSAMSCERWQSVHTGTSSLWFSTSDLPCTLFDVHVGDGRVAACAGARDRGARLAGRLDAVRAVAVAAERGARVALREQRVVHAVERLRVVVEVAGLAGVAERRAEVRHVLERALRVGDLAEPGVAVGALEVLPVHGLGEHRLVHLERV